MRRLLPVFFVLSAAGLMSGWNTPTSSGKATPPVPSSTTKAGTTQAGSPQSFDTVIKPLFAKSCYPCHNDRMASGSLNLQQFTSAAAIAPNREQWERIVQKIRTGEMPPKGMPKPSLDTVNSVVAVVRDEFEKSDRATPADPGRVTARRLNRVEYSNTIRDLLGVDYRADKDFPTDDSGHGFDNIGDVLTISPVLMEKYLTAAERISARALGADPLPKPVEVAYESKHKTIRRIDRSTIEATHRVDFDAEYQVLLGLPGERAKDAAPVQLGFWMDGKLVHTQTAETKPSGLNYFNPYSEETFRLYIPEGDHVFRAGFIGDDFVKSLTDKEAYSDKKNKYLNMIKFMGPYPAKGEKASRRKLLICDPAKAGVACTEKIVATLARRAYRRPVSKAETAGLMRFVKMGQTEGQSVEQGLQLAIQAMLVSPHFLFRIERDIDPLDPGKVHRISDLELASRLSYFLWSSTPDETLLGLAESRKLHEPAVLDVQIKRMLDDDRSAALAANFAGQWLEIRNLDSVKPDPGKFPDWGPELRDAMRTETKMFFETMLREDRPLSDFINAKFTFLNERLAKHYGMTGIEGEDFRRVELTSDQRGGILSHASVLTVSSYPTRTSPVIRGKYVLQNILGAPPPSPPADVPALDESEVGNAGSLRQQMEKHRSNAMCASCHVRMDAIGFGLENYDAIGRWRTKDGKFDIDTAGTFPNGNAFVTPAEMRTLLTADTPDFARCLTEKMLTYGLGRGLEPYDRRAVEGITKKVAANDYKFQSLIYEVVRSLPFQSRRGEAVRKETAKR
ncbi:MAG: DUF1592 domain-containing protein [Bryobacteraceae bacterium]|nr:DUF1592 domain-containing protein [Bryobacteraceae bacterium]